MYTGGHVLTNPWIVPPSNFEPARSTGAVVTTIQATLNGARAAQLPNSASRRPPRLDPPTDARLAVGRPLEAH